MTKCVLSEDVEEGLRLVTLNRPHRLNAIVPALLEDLVEAMEAAEGAPAAEAMAEMLAGAIKRDLGVSARIALRPFGSLPRTEGKTRRVVRKDRP